MALVNIICEKYASCKPTFLNLSGFLDDRYSDVTVSVSYAEFETKSYKLHRNVLAGCSTALHKRLDDHQHLEITFMSPAEFELLIIFLYTGDVHFKSVSELCSGLYAARMYGLDNLQSACTTRLQEKVEEDSGNCLLILQLDERFKCRWDNEVLFNQIDEIIKKEYRQILSSELIEDLENDMLKHLLQMDSIFGVPEIEVFRALSRWTNAQCNKSGIERVGEYLQKMARDLIYLIRYNLIPIEIIGTEIADSGLLPEKLFALIIRRCYNDKIEVPFCTESRELKLKTEEVQFQSICTLEEHVVSQKVSQWSTVDTLSWNREEGDSDLLPLSAVAATNTRWEVQFGRNSYDDILYGVQCASLDAQFRAASVRLYMVVEDHPQIWTEVADVLQSSDKSGDESGEESGEESSEESGEESGEESADESGENSGEQSGEESGEESVELSGEQLAEVCGVACIGIFSKKVSELSNIRPVKVRVQAQWSELVKLPSAHDLWMDRTAHISCRWQVKDWRTVTPTSSWWSLYSEPFGQKGALWRIAVVNAGKSDSDRKLVVMVQLQHLPASVDFSEMSWKCSLSVWDRQFDEKKKNMEQKLCCAWPVVDDVKSELRNPLDLNVVIHVSSEN